MPTTIVASQLDNIFSSGQPWARNGQSKFQLQLAASMSTTSGILGVAIGGITATHLAVGSVTPSSLAITSIDVPHSSPSVAATDVRGAVEENALGYLARVQKAGDAMSGVLSMGLNKITNLAAAVDPGDAVNLSVLQTAVSRGDNYFTPTTYGNPLSAHGTLQATWIRASASFYFSAVPALGDTITIHGVTFVYVDVVLASNQILRVAGDVPTTVAHTVSALNASTLTTLDLIAFNTNFWCIQDTGIGWAFHVVVINEDLPNTPEDGDNKLAGEVSSVITHVPFRGGLDVANDGMVVLDIYTDTLYSYDRMLPSAPWVPVQGGTNAALVMYTGPNLPNIPVTSPDNLQSILIAIDNALGAGGLPAHASTHEYPAGTDQINVAGLSGLLADPQTPDLHVTTHENGGGPDELNVAGLSGVLADPQDAGSLRGETVDTATPVLYDVLTYDGAKWTPSALSAIASPIVLTGLSGTGLALGDAVYVSAANAVTKAQANSTTTMPSVGVVSRVSPLEVTVVGKITGLTGMVAGSVYYVSPTTPGVITITPPSTSGQLLQVVAIGLDATTIVVLPVQFTLIT